VHLIINLAPEHSYFLGKSKLPRVFSEHTLLEGKKIFEGVVTRTILRFRVISEYLLDVWSHSHGGKWDRCFNLVQGRRTRKEKRVEQRFNEAFSVRIRFGRDLPAVREGS